MTDLQAVYIQRIDAALVLGTVGLALIVFLLAIIAVLAFRSVK